MKKVILTICVFLLWKTQQRKYLEEKCSRNFLCKTIKHEQKVWHGILHHVDETLFFAKRGIAFRGDSNKIGDAETATFLASLNH